MVVTTEQGMVTRADLAIMVAWGIRLRAWRALTDQQRAYYRDNVAHADHVTSAPCNAWMA